MWEIRCEPVEPARLCRECGIPAPVRSSRWRRFVHTPLGKAGVHLLARVFVQWNCGRLSIVFQSS